METQTIINISISLIFSMFLGGLNSLLSYFLDYCFWEGSIFQGWLPFLAKINLKIFKPETFNSIQSAKKNPQYNNMLCELATNTFFYKILGGCVVCSNIWLGAFTFFFISAKIDLSFYYLFPYLLFSSFLLRKITKN